MLYITGIHALNIDCSLKTCGDWHASALKWNNIMFKESENSFFGEYGIESDKVIPEHIGKFYVANHIRALLDLLEMGYFSIAQGMNNDFICNSQYDKEIFDKVYSMQGLKNWDKINNFMSKEYMLKWINYLKRRTAENEQ